MSALLRRLATDLLVKSGLAVLLLAVAAAGCHRAPAKQQAAAPEAETGAASEAPAKAEPAAWTLPVPELGYDAREGQAVFQHYCATCHGAEGHGDGFNAYNLDPKPRDLSDPKFQAARTDVQLAAVIRSGGPAAGLSTGMPPWGRTLSERRIRELVIYLRTLKPEADSN
jgi:mono/diheme cytochrome c family protein